MNKTILIVDDDKKILDLVQFALDEQGYETRTAQDGASAIEALAEFAPALVVLDIRLPDQDGITILQKMKKIAPQTVIVMMSAHGTIKLALESIKLGAYDFVEKPFELEEFELKIKHAMENSSLHTELEYLRNELGEKYQSKHIVGDSKGMKEVLNHINVASESNVSVLIEGETGTGKELVARAIHFSGARKGQPFIGINCAALPSNLLESELFGHEKGAFTGALARKIGKFEQANGGTVFLDEIGDLSQELQVKLLRVLQEKEVERVGGSESISIDVRIVSATNKDISKLISEGEFREDLYYRINVLKIPVPSLRERREDIPKLVQYFIKKYCREGQSIQVDSNAMNQLLEYSWPGNIRELENFIERSLLTKQSGQDVLTEGDLQYLSSSVSKPIGDGHVQTRDEAEKTMIENALQEANGNIAKASKLLNISRDTFYRKMKKFSIPR